MSAGLGVVEEPPPTPVLPADPPAALPFVLAGAFCYLVVAGARAMLGTGSLGWPGLAAAGAGVLVLCAVAVLGLLVRPKSANAARALFAAALAAVAGYPVVAVAVLGPVALPETGVLAVLLVLGVALADWRWLAGVALVLWLAFAAALVPGVPPSDWFASAAVLAAATAAAALLEAGRRRAAHRTEQMLDEQERVRGTDPLTGLVSRRGLALVASRIVEAARRQGDAVHCLFVSVGDLRSVQARLGTFAGDQVLVAAAHALQHTIRSTDVASRWERDVFCVVGPGVGVPPYELERRVRDRLRAEPPVPPEVWTPGITTAAAALAPWDAGTLSTLLGLGEQELHVREVLRGRGGRPGRSDATA